jgi:VWFA-related protein
VNQGSAQELVFRSRTDLVLVDVVVTDDDGRPVRGLRKEDFRIEQDGHPQTIVDFRAVEIPAARRSLADVDPEVNADVFSNEIEADARLVVLLVDDLSLELNGETITRVKTLLGDLLAALSPNDHVAIVFLSRSDLSIDFTADAGLQVRAAERVRAALAGAASLHRAHDARTTLFGVRNAVGALANAGYARRILVFVSQGIGLGFSILNSTDSANARAELLDIIRRARAGGVVVYAVDPRGPLFEPSWQPHEWLHALALGTGGRAVVQRTMTAAIADDIASENGTFYVLGYEPSPFVMDGRYHAIAVDVRQPGLRVQARAGYIAPSRSEGAEGGAGALEAALAASTPSAGFPVRALAAPVDGVSAGRATVQIVAEVRYPLGPPPSGDEVELGVLALDSDAHVVASTRRIVRVEPPADGRGDGRSRWLVRLEVPRGAETLRIGAVSDSLGRAGTVHLPIDVPDFHGKLAISAPIFGWNGRSGPLESTDRQDIFVPFEPTLEREFASSDPPELFVRFVWQAASARPLSTTIELRRAGDVVTRLPQFLDAVSRDEPGRWQAELRMRLPIADQLPGSYVLHVVARLGDGTTSRRSVPFSVR